MKHKYSGVILGLCLGYWPLAVADSPTSETTVQAPASNPNVAAVQGLLDHVSLARGVQRVPSIQVRVQTPAQVREVIAQELDDPWAAADLACQSALLDVLRQKDPQLDLRAALLDAYTDQVAGYYDPKTKELVLVSRDGVFDGSEHGLSNPTARMTMTHELVHAAQDAAFDLRKLTERDYPTLDVQLAVQSMIEGDATWWMVPLLSGGDADQLRALDTSYFETMINSQVKTIFSGVSSLSKLPTMVRYSMIKPYIAGFAYIHALQHDGGTALVDKAFINPPLSTEMIMHPDRARGAFRDLPNLIKLDLEPAMLGPGWQEVCTTGLGEMLLDGAMRHAVARLEARGLSNEDTQALKTASYSLAQGWDGDRIRIFRGPAGRLAAVWVVVWDGEQEPELAHSLTALTVLASAQPHDPAKPRVLPHRRKKVGLVARSNGRVWSASLMHGQTTLLVGIPRGVARRVERALREAERIEMQSLDAVAPVRVSKEVPPAP